MQEERSLILVVLFPASVCTIIRLVVIAMRIVFPDSV